MGRYWKSDEEKKEGIYGILEGGSGDKKTVVGLNQHKKGDIWGIDQKRKKEKFLQKKKCERKQKRPSELVI